MREKDRRGAPYERYAAMIPGVTDRDRRDCEIGHGEADQARSIFLKMFQPDPPPVGRRYLKRGKFRSEIDGEMPLTKNGSSHAARPAYLALTCRPYSALCPKDAYF